LLAPPDAASEHPVPLADVQDEKAAVSVMADAAVSDRPRSPAVAAPAADLPPPQSSAPAPAPSQRRRRRRPASAPEAPAELPSPEAREDAPAAQSEEGTTPKYVAKYGFYIHAYNFPAAVIYQVRQLHKFFPGSPVYIMSDGGYRFDGLCKRENCTFVLCPPANDRWHPWPFFRRMYDAAVSLNTEYVIMLEPDNTIHGPITRHPTHDAGGLYVQDRGIGYRDYAVKLAQEVKPGFKWRERSVHAGLCGGSYYRTATILDAMSDEAVAHIDWNYLGEMATKEVMSSDFAMPYLLAARGWDVEPWEDAAQMERSKTKPYSGPADAAIRHYGGGYPGGKPTYNLRLEPEDAKLVKDPLPLHNRYNTNCQICYSLKTYVERFGSDQCTNKYDFKYSKVMKKRYPGR